MFHNVDRPMPQSAPKVLLLQGPVGPFFRDLQAALCAQGFQAKHVTFHAGDALFAARDQTVEFSGSLEEWARWLDDELRRDPYDFIVMFGAMRPAHYVARQIAELHNLHVICLEEGYLRSGYITCEIGGNNAGSPLCQWVPGSKFGHDGAAPAAVKHAYLKMCLWAAIYYLRRDFRPMRAQKPLFHRPFEGPLRLCASWAAHAVLRCYARQSARGLLRQLRGRLRKKFLLVILQVPSDSQLRYAARGWSNEKLIRETLLAFKHTQSRETLVFKLHPLDRQAPPTQQLIRQMARELGVSDRVRILKAGAIGAVAQHATGMIVINSTSAFSALRHNIPLLVMGDAIYRHDTVVTVGNDPLDIWEFLNDRAVKSANATCAFTQAVKANALLPGDYYCAKGRTIAAEAVTRKLLWEIARTPAAAAAQIGAA